MGCLWTDHQRLEQSFLECTSIYYNLNHYQIITEYYKRLESIYIKYVLLLNARELYEIHRLKDKLKQRLSEFLEVANRLN